MQPLDAITERNKKNLHFWIPFAISMAGFMFLWRLNDPDSQVDPTFVNFLIKLVAIWFLIFGFMFAYMHWNGSKHLKKIGDDIRIIPHYKGLIAKSLFPRAQTVRLDLYFMLAMVCIFFVDWWVFFFFLVWGTAGYYGLIGTHMLFHLEMMSRKAALVHKVLWGGIFLWAPAYLRGVSLLMNFCFDDDNNVSDCIVLIAFIMIIPLVLFALYLPIRVAFPLYTRALKEVRVLEQVEAACGLLNSDPRVKRFVTDSR